MSGFTSVFGKVYEQANYTVPRCYFMNRRVLIYKNISICREGRDQRPSLPSPHFLLHLLNSTTHEYCFSQGFIMQSLAVAGFGLADASQCNCETLVESLFL